MKTKVIEAYSFAEFCQKAQEGFEQGFKFDFESNERYPTAFGSFHTAIMVDSKIDEKQIDETLSVVEVVEQTISEVTEAVATEQPEKKARKPRNS